MTIKRLNFIAHPIKPLRFKLSQCKFEVGDYIDVLISPPAPGSVPGAGGFGAGGFGNNRRGGPMMDRGGPRPRY